MLRTITVEWDDLKAVIQEQSAIQFLTENDTFTRVLSIIRGEKVERLSDAKINGVEDTFLLLVSRTIETDGFTWCKASGSDKEIKAAYKAFPDLPGGFVRNWYDAYQKLAKPPVGDRDLAPPDTLDDGQKKVEK